jgi:hypothetical protein
MLRLAVRAGKPDPNGLREIVDPQEDEIEPARAHAACLQVAAQVLAKPLDHALQILGIVAAGCNGSDH